MRPHGSFSDFVRKSSCPCAAARPRRIEVAASSVHASQRDASESRSLTKATRLRRPLWVKNESVVPEVRLPLYPGERTSWATAATSEKCQQQTHAPRGKSRPIDPSVDADEHGSFGQPRLPKT